MFGGYYDSEGEAEEEDDLEYESKDADDEIDEDLVIALYGQLHHEPNIDTVDPAEFEVSMKEARATPTVPNITNGTEAFVRDYPLNDVTSIAQKNTPVFPSHPVTASTTQEVPTSIVATSPAVTPVSKPSKKETKKTKKISKTQVISSIPKVDQPTAKDGDFIVIGSDSDFEVEAPAIRFSKDPDCVEISSSSASSSVNTDSDSDSDLDLEVGGFDDAYDLENEIVTNLNFSKSSIILDAADLSDLEDFTLESIHNSMADASWNVIPQDRLRGGHREAARGSSFLKRYYVPMNVRCANCNEKGHLSKTCPQPKKKPACILCGLRGHMSRSCPDSLCFNCSSPGHNSKDCKEQRRYHNGTCHRCGMFGHRKGGCPEQWRQFCLTITEGGMNKSANKKNKRIFCYNCAKRGHFGHECGKAGMDKFTQFSSPHIASYDEHRVNKRKIFDDEDVDDEPLRKKLKKVKKVRSDLPFKCAQKKRPINKREKLAAKNLGDFPRNSKKRLPKNSGDFPRGMGWKDPSLNQEAVASARRAARNVVADRPGACGGKWDKTQKKMMKKMKKMKKEGAQNTQVVNSRYMQFAGMDIDGGWKGNGDNTGNNLHEKKKKKKIKNNKRKYPDRNVAQNRGHGKVATSKNGFRMRTNLH